MKNPLRNIAVAFVVVAVVPVAYLLYQLSQVSNNEKMVRETYQNQLDALLYSVNQYSDDVLSNWASRIREKASTDSWEADTTSFFQGAIIQGGVVEALYLQDSVSRGRLVPFSGNRLPANLSAELGDISHVHRESLQKLVKYQRAGFHKVETMPIKSDDYLPVFFALDEGSPFQVAALIVNVRAFIRNNLAPKMQLVSQEKFTISALRYEDDSVLYSTDITADIAELQRAARVLKSEMTKKFWVLPGYYLGISLRGATIDDLVRERSKSNLYLLASFLMVLVTGIIFLYRNIRRELQLSQAKSEFVANVSHEIRTPLSLIGMFAETLEQGRVATDEKRREYYQIIVKETARLTRIVNRILNFSQMEANRKEFKKRPLQLNELCREILDTYAEHFHDKGFEVVFSEGGIPSVVADREAVAEAIINLVDNAVKYSLQDKRLEVSTSEASNEVMVAVKDHGIGIDKAHHHSIFEQFFRAPSGDVHTTKGTGLGLALVKRIMEAHGGSVTVESVPGKGSTFRLVFPLPKLKDA